MLSGACVRHAAWCLGALRAMLGHCTSGGLPLPQAKGPSTVARLVIHFEPESHSRGSGSFVVRGGGGSQKVVVALQAWTPPRKIRRQFQGYKHISLNPLVAEPSLVRLSSAQKTKLVTFVVTFGRR